MNYIYIVCFFVAYGYFSCQFDTNALCGMNRTSAGDFIWYYGSGASPNYPDTGPGSDKNGNSANSYVYIDSGANVVSKYKFSLHYSRD